MVDSVVTWATRLQGRRLPLRPDGPPQQGEHAGRARGAGRADACPRTASTARRSTSTARAGTSARSPTTPASSRPPRATSAAPGSARSPTGCATPCAAAGRSTTTRACRASAPACPPTRTAPRSTARRPSRPRLLHDTDLVQLGLAGNLRGFTLPRQRRRDGRAATQVDYNGAPAGYADEPDEVDQLRRRARQRDAVRRADVQAAAAHVDGRPGADEHAVAGHHRAGADAVVLARRRRPAAQQVAGPQQLRLAATGSTGSTGPAPDNGFGHGLPPEARQRAPSGRS